MPRTRRTMIAANANEEDNSCTCSCKCHKRGIKTMPSTSTQQGGLASCRVEHLKVILRFRHGKEVPASSSCRTTKSTFFFDVFSTRQGGSLPPCHLILLLTKVLSCQTLNFDICFQRRKVTPPCFIEIL